MNYKHKVFLIGARNTMDLESII